MTSVTPFIFPTRGVISRVYLAPYGYRDVDSKGYMERVSLEK